MSRRVIFPDPNIWTEPKEARMTTYADQPGPADDRRAAALILHRRSADEQGVVAILAEAGETKRQVQLLLAVMDLYRNAIAELRSDAGIELMASYVGDMAQRADEAEGPAADMVKAAPLLDAHAREDWDAFNDVLARAASAGRSANLLIGLLDLYEVLMPDLNSTTGRDWFTRLIAAFVNEEVQGDG